MRGRSRILLAWSLWLGTLARLVGGLVVTLAVTLPLLLLPDGRLRSRRWRVVAAVAVAATTFTRVGWALVFASIPAAALSAVLRFRSSRGVERQQLRWVAAGAATAAAGQPGRGRVVPAAAPPGPGPGRPPLQPAPL